MSSVGRILIDFGKMTYVLKTQVTDYPSFSPIILMKNAAQHFRSPVVQLYRIRAPPQQHSRLLSNHLNLTFSRTRDLHPDHAQSLLGSTRIKFTTLSTSNMATCWNRSSTSCLFTDQRPIPKPHAKPSDLNSNAIMHLHRSREQSHPLLTFSFNLPNELNPKPSALTDSLCPVFTHLRRSPLITNMPIKEVVTNGPSFFSSLATPVVSDGTPRHPSISSNLF
ncbi:hypothetical protein LXL04_024179 [Taraxacum kok-saghyz]